jgi:hypothetical protein
VAYTHVGGRGVANAVPDRTRGGRGTVAVGGAGSLVNSRIHSIE